MVEYEDFTDLEPATISIIGNEGDGTRVTPVYVGDVEGQFTPNNESDTDQCGNTEVTQNGGKNWRVTIEGTLVEQQLIDLISLRLGSGPLEIITDGLAGTFLIGQFTFNQTDEEVYGRFNDPQNPNQTIEGLVYTFQLQTKAPDEESAG